MAVLIINTMDDLKKLTGWTIKGAFKASDRAMAIAFVLSHPAAENDVMFIIDAAVKKKRELAKEATEAKEVIDFVQGLPGVPDLDVEFLFLLYRSSENLVKHSNDLTKLTIALFFISLGMIALALAQWIERLTG